MSKRMIRVEKLVGMKNAHKQTKTPTFLLRSLSFMDSIGSASLQNDILRA